MAQFINNPTMMLQASVAPAETEEDRFANMKDIARKILVDDPAWSGAANDQIDVSQLTGGLSNLLYCLTEKESGQRIIVRLFGAGTEQYIDRSWENLVFSELSKRSIGPTFHGIFLDGRIEGFLDATPLDALSMCQDGIYQAVAAATAQLHVQDIPGMAFRDPVWLWKTTSHFFRLTKDAQFSEAKQQYIRDNIDIPLLERELTWFIGFTEEKQSQYFSPSDATSNSNPTAVDASTAEASSPASCAGVLFGFQKVLCHNDLLCGNLLLHNYSYSYSLSEVPAVAAEKKITLIDYEYASYNYRAFDIANHFNECCGYECDYENLFPSVEAMTNFLRAYIVAIQRGGATIDGYLVESETEFLAGLLLCVKWFVLASHLFWGAWALVQASSSEALGIDFDYLNYAKLRFNGYFMFKRLFT